MISSVRKQAGVTLVTAIFLLVVLAGLAVAVVSLSTKQQTNAARDELGTRALLAAKAGLQWALFQATQGTGADNYTRLGCANPITFAMPQEQGNTLSTFTVTIQCTSPTADATVYGDGSANDPTINRFRITVTACNGALGAACPAANRGPDYVQRVVTAQL